MMGNKQSAEKSDSQPALQGKEAVYVMKHPGHCTGMFWRPNPQDSKQKQIGGDDWPRNQSRLIGTKQTLGGQDWLEVTSWVQAGKQQWSVGCEGLWMPFEQGGLLLHEA
ncbi:hypothetical protein SARC_10145 [Sphaeroforma arctica JP610]|uniref:Uncharacterized protein n=1 Tax=Sphaeroforma arctica JP610 TaxID=667725 RepID=A0A0L0FKT0_9EUKA|nr:hypothetical protein SARC_10145 [Sphaeroforma arctica JP610]KNC77394.1 hypothetical protein SARC_10145 [Sphaeroforma arctica JP610]|eukprot:XP_014151296.1 hypothetical protein SARC_10145 [Sphaeroforma arctica JP610]